MILTIVNAFNLVAHILFLSIGWISLLMIMLLLQVMCSALVIFKNITTRKLKRK